MKTGRNDPCPCGSGKKYKKCCLVSGEDTEFRYRRLRQTHAEVIPRLTDFVLDNFDREFFEGAWQDFNDQQATQPYDPRSPMNVVFMPWFLFNWIVELKPAGGEEFVETTFAEAFLFSELANLTSDEQLLLSTSNRCPYTLCEVVDVTPREGMVLSEDRKSVV